MYNMIERYMKKIKKEDVSNFAIKKNITLSDDELDFSYNFIKKNWDKILSNPNLLNMNRYKNQFSLENYQKINELIKEYYSKYRYFI